MNNVKESVLHKIKQGEVSMRPRWYFVLKSFLVLAGMCILGLWLIYLVSFIIFALVTSGVIIIPIFGIQGLIEFLFALPWLLIVIAILFVVLLEILVNRYSFGYRKPLLYTLFTIIGLTVMGTFLVSQSGIHDMAMQRSVERQLPIFGEMYKGYGIPPNERIHIGEIIVMNDKGFILDERIKGKLNIILNNQTQQPKGTIFNVGDHVIVFGPRQADEVQAFGVKYFLGKMFRPIEKFENKIFKEESEL